jgi:hypothetical protein
MSPMKATPSGSTSSTVWPAVWPGMWKARTVLPPSAQLAPSV